jgi:ssDNA-binding Zn-finger/Zn-ribbon topoisomerase 1
METETKAMYTQFRVKCMDCGLHFIVCTDYPDWWAKKVVVRERQTPMYCPECGQHKGKFITWKAEVEGFIFQAVPGDDVDFVLAEYPE